MALALMPPAWPPIRSLPPVTPPAAPTLREALAFWTQARLHQLRRSGRADRAHARRAGRAPALALREVGSCTRSTTACCCPAPRRSSSPRTSAGSCTAPAAASPPGCCSSCRLCFILIGLVLRLPGASVTSPLVAASSMGSSPRWSRSWQQAGWRLGSASLKTRLCTVAIALGARSWRASAERAVSAGRCWSPASLGYFGARSRQRRRWGVDGRRRPQPPAAPGSTTTPHRRRRPRIAPDRCCWPVAAASAVGLVVYALLLASGHELLTRWPGSSPKRRC